jgi:hypothetical protein
MILRNIATGILGAAQRGAVREGTRGTVHDTACEAACPGPRETVHETMRRTLRRMGLAALVALALTACGGSGSSGFDGELNSEADAIERATSEGTCVEFEGTTYCGSGAPWTLGDDTVAVDFDEASGPVPCTRLPDDSGCTTAVGFQPSGFPETTVLLGAWAESASGPWTLSVIDQTPAGESGEDGDVVVVLPGAGGDNAPAIVIAVLVYFDGMPEDVADVAPTLAEFGPDVVYLSPQVEVAAPALE